MPVPERRRRTDKWPFGGRQNTLDAWLNAGSESVGSLWNLLVERQSLHPDSLRGIGGYGNYVRATDIHPLVWLKPDALSRFRNARKAFIAVMAPSAGGKDTILRAIQAAHPSLIDMVVTHTTKPPRPEDVRGKTYHFVNNDEFDRLVKEGAFAEYLPQFGRRYGTSYEALQASIDAPQPIVVWRGEPIGWNRLQFELTRRFQGVPFGSVFILPEISVSKLTEWIISKRSSELPVARIEKAIIEIYAGGAMDACVVNPYQEEGPVAATEALFNLFSAVQQKQGQIYPSIVG